MKATNIVTRGILNAHKNYLNGKLFLEEKKQENALECFLKSKNLFQEELNRLCTFDTRLMWEQELKLVNQEIFKLEKGTKLNLDKFTEDTDSSSRFDRWISRIREVHPRSGTMDTNVIGLELVKGTLDKVISLPLERPDIWIISPSPPRSILLYGAPGCGKTLIVKVTAQKAGLPIYNITLGELLSKWFGESEKKIEYLFEVAYKEPDGCILFFDEIDALVGQMSNDSDAINRVRKAFLTALDGYKVPKPNKVIVIGLTNRPDLLDGATMRRFDRRVYVPPPNYDAILKLIQNIVNKTDMNLDLFSDSWQKVIHSMLGLTADEICKIIHGAIWETADSIINREEELGEKFLKKIKDLLLDMTPYFCTFEALEPSVFLFLDKQYGFPKTKEEAYCWEPSFNSRKHRLIQLHPEPKVIHKRKLSRRI